MLVEGVASGLRVQSNPYSDTRRIDSRSARLRKENSEQNYGAQHVEAPCHSTEPILDLNA